MDSDSIKIQIEKKLASGALPRSFPAELWGGYGDGQCCSACDEPIARSSVLFEQDGDGGSHRFHARCFNLVREAQLQFRRAAGRGEPSHSKQVRAFGSSASYAQRARGQR
jgi:hypothetical protein